VEVRAQLPKGDWIWPAIWMLPRWNTYGGWPASGEIDIMESRGNSPASYPNTPGVGGGHNSYSSTLHWGANWASNQYERTHGEFNGAPLADEFHTYGMLWNEQGITSYIDDESNTVLHVPFSGKSLWDRSGLEAAGWNNPWEGRPRHAPFDQEFFLLMNVAVGGTGSYFPDGLGGKPWSNKDEHAVNAFWNARHAWMNTWKGEQTAMKIDWVRVYQA
jgi:beta-glucanase (GH16 family)